MSSNLTASAKHGPLAQSGLRRRPVTAEITGSNPVRVAKFKDTNSNFYNFFGIKEKMYPVYYIALVLLGRPTVLQTVEASSILVRDTNMP